MKICRKQKKYFEIIMQITTAQQIPGECLRLWNKIIIIKTFFFICYFILIISNFLNIIWQSKFSARYKMMKWILYIIKEWMNMFDTIGWELCNTVRRAILDICTIAMVSSLFPSIFMPDAPIIWIRHFSCWRLTFTTQSLSGFFGSFSL